MEIQCPACRKLNQVTRDSDCQRCGCDLSRLWETRQAASWRLDNALRHLRERAWADARAQAEQSWALRHSSESAQIACLTSAALRDLAKFRQWQRRVNGR